MDLESIRREYRMGGLRRSHLAENPFQQLEHWMKQAIEANIPDPTAFVLATVDAKGQPEQRILLLKLIDANGLVFFTNYQSDKARDMAANPHVSMHFPWHHMERQIRVSGIARKIAVDESRAYFNSRPRESQLAAWASPQSSRIDSRQVLLNQFEEVKARFGDANNIPLPDFWGGYRVEPERFEFWQGGASRLHDRFEYCRQADGSWAIGRLAP